MLPFKWTANRMNIIIAVLVSELCKLSEQSWTTQTGDQIHDNMDTCGTNRTLFQGGNEVFQIPSNETTASGAARLWVTAS